MRHAVPNGAGFQSGGPGRTVQRLQTAEAVAVAGMTPTPLRKPLRFYNPIAGKPVPFNLSGLFLFDPDTMLKLHGLSFRRMLSEEFDDAFFKKWERVSKGKQHASSKFGLEFLDRLPVEVPFFSEMRAAFSGDVSAQTRMESIGPWETFLLGSGEDLQGMSGRGRLLLAIERASCEPSHLIRAGAISEAVAMMQTDPVISLFLWPEVIEVMEGCKSAKQLPPTQAAIATEVLLSYVAAADAELASADESAFACLLPGQHAPGKNPTSLFIAYLRDAIGAKSLRAVLDHPKAEKLSLDMATLKRWSAGSHYPDPVWLRPVLKAFFGDASYAPVTNRYWGARYFSLIGYFAQTVATRARKQPVMSEQALAFRPWPRYPFGYSNCESWMQSRYPYWFDYHLKQRQVLTDGAREKRPMGLFS